MSRELFSPAPEITISTAGPHAIPHPYSSGSIRLAVIKDGERTEIAPADFTVMPEDSTIAGNVTLSPEAFALHTGGKLYITRDTPVQQGFEGTSSSREKGMEAQLDLLTEGLQEIQSLIGRTLRADTPVEVMVRAPGRVVIFDDDGNPIPGPTADQVEGSQQAAVDAIAAMNAAAAIQAALAAFSLSILAWHKGNWATATAYVAGDIVTQDGGTFYCLLAHTSGVFATDKTDGKWGTIAAKGAAGLGSGDVLVANLLSEFSDPGDAAAAVSNLGFSSFVAGLRASADAAAFMSAAGITSALAGKQAQSTHLTALVGLPVIGNAALPVRINAAGDGFEAFRQSAQSSMITAPGGPYSTAGLFPGGTNIPADATEIEIDIVEMSLSGNGNLFVQLGDSAGFVSTNYDTFSGDDGGGDANSSQGFVVRLSNLTETFGGKMTFTKHPNGDFSAVHTFSNRGDTAVSGEGAIKVSNLGGKTIDRLVITMSGGQTFDVFRGSVKWRR